jgi:glycerol kinase
VIASLGGTVPVGSAGAPHARRRSGVASDDGHPVERRARVLILAIDQGTTGTTCLVVDDRLRAVGRGYREIRQSFPRPGWVEHDPDEIWASVEQTAAAALADAGVGADDLTAIGITNQRETTVVWERATGRPVHPAIVWQDRRTAERCAELPALLIRERTGLVPDPYFSATKLEWILARTEQPTRDLAFGTIDSWLVWKLTAGSTHVTDVTNASRTMLLDLAAGAWDDELLGLFGVDRAVLPEVVRSSGVIDEAMLFGARVPIGGIAGDQQSALFGQGCFTPGEAKATYGTGTFVLVALGEDAGASAEGLLTTAAAVPPDSAPQYAAEGAVLVGGAALQWLRDGLGVIQSAAESERLATSVESTDGVTFVPALTGLGSPQWQPDARGLISGLTRGTTRAHLVRAALEAVAHQVADVLDALPLEVGVLRADGGATANGFLMQLQADLAGCPVEVAADADATALGAAALAGLAAGTWSDPEEVAALIRRGARYEPRMRSDEVEHMRHEWREALRRVLL